MTGKSRMASSRRRGAGDGFHRQALCCISPWTLHTALSRASHSGSVVSQPALKAHRALGVGGLKPIADRTCEGFLLAGGTSRAGG